jgi:hypothetical protein
VEAADSEPCGGFEIDERHFEEENLVIDIKVAV